MNDREYQEILVIHNDAIYQHQMMYRYMSDWLSRFDITVLRFRDWLSEVSVIPNQSEKTYQGERLQKPPQYRKPLAGIKTGYLNDETTKKIISLTPGLIVFDLDHHQMTNEMKRELKLITLAEKGIQQKGGLAIVQFGDPGWFTRQYPHLIADILHIDSFSEESHEFSSTDMEFNCNSERKFPIEDLSLFAFRHLMQVCFSRKVNLKSLREIGQALYLLRFFFSKLREITSTLKNSYQIEETAKTIERYLTWCQSYLYYLGVTDFHQRFPEFNSWIYNEFDGICLFRDLSQRGQQMTIAILQALGKHSLVPLLSICQSPCFSESPKVYITSPFLAQSAVKAVDFLAGKNSYQLLTERIDHSHDVSHTYWLLRSIGKWAKDKSRPIKLQVSTYLVSVAEKKNCDPRIQTGGVEALGDAGVGFAIKWLESLYEKEIFDDDLRGNVVLALMNLLGREAGPLVIDYIKHASEINRQIIASAAWLVDDDALFNQFLYELTLGEDEDDLIANLIYSLVRTSKGTAYQLIFHGLNSKNLHLRKTAAVMAADCMIRCPEHIVNKPILINRLEKLVRSAEAPLNEYALLSLIRSGIDEYRSKGQELVEQYLRQKKSSMARMAILEAGLAYSDWPSDLHASWWLNHPLAEIRHVMVYLLGYQRRLLLMEASEYLKGDISMVFPYFNNPKTLEITGRTISEAMDLSLRRLAGKIPQVKVDRETYFYKI